jgi:hypothetical protein
VAILVLNYRAQGADEGQRDGRIADE